MLGMMCLTSDSPTGKHLSKDMSEHGDFHLNSDGKLVIYRYLYIVDLPIEHCGFFHSSFLVNVYQRVNSINPLFGMSNS